MARFSVLTIFPSFLRVIPVPEGPRLLFGHFVGSEQKNEDIGKLHGACFSRPTLVPHIFCGFCDRHYATHSTMPTTHPID
ncbi:hypothetical protein B0H14DRAFT_2861852 [Mycena olivaceomarginata]|nr:hypothetical protein B0H14DRAFT_2861852 [Mycena olivaceomarginata]